MWKLKCALMMLIRTNCMRCARNYVGWSHVKNSFCGSTNTNAQLGLNKNQYTIQTEPVALFYHWFIRLKRVIFFLFHLKYIVATNLQRQNKWKSSIDNCNCFQRSKKVPSLEYFPLPAKSSLASLIHPTQYTCHRITASVVHIMCYMCNSY